ncbi:hypothetical protein NFI96_014461 [Prochilodus magdalenae]|nr:hypothetical protein NFI96_014461 [Prochilodus magdalenae]
MGYTTPVPSGTNKLQRQRDQGGLSYPNFLYYYWAANIQKALLWRVHINPKLIQKVKLTKTPESVQQLKDELREKLELDGEFSVQYEDPDLVKPFVT